MDEIKRADSKNAAIAALNPGRLIILGCAAFLGWNLIANGDGFVSWGIALWLTGAGLYGYSAWQEMLRRRFINLDHARLWSIIRDRVSRFRKALKNSPKHIGFDEMPKTVERTAKNLYDSLRRADVVKAEILKSEGSIGISSMPFQVRAADPETNELYLLADKNVAEYRKYYETLNAKVTRTEGQCALFISVLDTLRVQLLGYRLAGQEPRVSKDEFIGTMAEVKLQLESINKALDELDLQPVQRVSNPPGV